MADDSFSWEHDSRIYICTAKRSSSLRSLCVSDAILQSLADHFIIANLVTAPIEFSNRFLLANYPSQDWVKNVDFFPYPYKLILSESPLQILSPHHYTKGMRVLNTLLYIQKWGVMTTRCMSNLSPSLSQDYDHAKLVIDSTPNNSCFLTNKNKYTFHIKDVKSVRLSPKRENYRQLQETVKAHIRRYGPVIGLIRFDYSINIVCTPSILFNERLNPDGVYLDNVHYKRDSQSLLSLSSKLEDDRTINHTISVIGWGYASISSSLIISEHLRDKDGGTVVVPYWRCRNNIIRDGDSTLFNYAMYPYNTKSPLEGGENSSTSLWSVPNSIRDLVHGGFILFKAGAIRDNSAQMNVIPEAKVLPLLGNDRKKLEYFMQGDPVNYQVLSNLSESSNTPYAFDALPIVSQETPYLSVFSRGNTPSTISSSSNRQQSKKVKSKKMILFVVVISILLVVCMYVCMYYFY